MKFKVKSWECDDYEIVKSIEREWNGKTYVKKDIFYLNFKHNEIHYCHSRKECEEFAENHHAKENKQKE